MKNTFALTFISLVLSATAMAADTVSCTGDIFRFGKIKGRLEKIELDQVTDKVIELQGNETIKVLESNHMIITILRGSFMGNELGYEVTINGETVVFYGDRYSKEISVGYAKTKEGRMTWGYDLRCVVKE